MKPNVLVIDDLEVRIVKQIIHSSILKGNCNIFECTKVEQGDDESTLRRLVDKFINEYKIIDFAFIDLQFDDEFHGMSIEEGGKRAFEMIRKHFPFCQIVFTTKNAGRVKDSKFYIKTGCAPLEKGNDPIEKSRDPEEIELANERINELVQEWIKLKCLQLNSAHNFARNKVIESITGTSVDWDCMINFNGECWTFEELFFAYKDFDLSTIREKLFGYLIKLPENIDKDIKPNKFSSNIFIYYNELYLKFYDDISIINDAAEDIINVIKDYVFKCWISDDFKFDEFKNNIQTKLLSYNIDKIGSQVPPVEHGYSSIEIFEKKLVIRLVYLASYIFLKLSPRVLYYVFSEFHTSEEDASRQTTNCIFLKGLEYKGNEETNDFFKVNRNKHKTEKDNRKYYDLLNKYSSNDEVKFLKDYYKTHLKKTFDTNQNLSSIYKDNLKRIRINVKNALGEEISFIE